MRDTVTIAGNAIFKETIVKQFKKVDVCFSEEENDTVAPLISEQTSFVFVDCATSSPESASYSLQNFKNVVLFAPELFTVGELNTLLELSLESRTLLINGDSLLFNPAIFETRELYKNVEFTTIRLNQFQQPIHKHNVFRCIELLLYTNNSAVKKVTANAVQLNKQTIHLLHVRMEFENGNTAIFELSNHKPKMEFTLEGVGNNSWVDLDLLSFNGEMFTVNDDENQTPKVIYAKTRNSMKNLMTYAQEQKKAIFNAERQFYATYNATQLILTIEAQLRREVPNFTHF